jgi:type II secretory pathway pseudopilin PulG
MSTVGEKHTFPSGFSFVEILVVVVVLVSLVLASITLLDNALIATTKASRDTERRSDVRSIALKLEQYYRANPTVNGSSYPTTTTMNNSLSTVIPEVEILRPPGINEAALVVATTNAAQDPTVDNYVYQPLNSVGALCSNLTAPCVRFVLYYKTEATNEVVTVESSHQQ